MRGLLGDGVEGDSVRQRVGGDEVRHNRHTGGVEEGAGDRGQEGGGVQVPYIKRTRPGEQGHTRADHGGERLAQHHDLPAVYGIGQRAADEREEEHGSGPEEAGQPQQPGRSSEFVDQKATGNPLHLLGHARPDAAGQQQPERRIPQRVKRAGRT